MNPLFPYDNIVVGILILIIGFGFHWIGQLISIINWTFATKIGIQEARLPKEYKVYEHAIAVSDSLIGWVYGFASVGLFLDVSWGYKLAWFPGVILLYHSFNYWFWTGNRRRDGNKLVSDTMRTGWSLANFITGVLTILLAWNAS
ncbi:MAG: hypothetical protein GY940_30295 [bacterium]|nr:hypothetical protein [bacterium]